MRTDCNTHRPIHMSAIIPLSVSVQLRSSYISKSVRCLYVKSMLNIEIGFALGFNFYVGFAVVDFDV